MLVILKNGDISDNVPELQFYYKDDIIVKLINWLNISIGLGIITKEEYMHEMDVLTQGIMRISFDMIRKSIIRTLPCEEIDSLEDDIDKITWKARFERPGDNYLYCNTRATSRKFKELLFSTTCSR